MPHQVRSGDPRPTVDYHKEDEQEHVDPRVEIGKWTVDRLPGYEEGDGADRGEMERD